MSGPNDKTKTFDKERVSFNLARLKMHGRNLEIVIEPDEAVEYKTALKSRKEKEMAEVGEPDVRDVLRSEEVFHDASKGELASENFIKEVFGTSDIVEIARKILLEGELQLTAEHRKRIMDNKKKRLVELIHRYAVDPTSGYPHPVERIERLLDGSHFRLNQYKKPEDQLDDAMHALKPIVPIKIEKKQIKAKIFKEFAHNVYGRLKSNKVLKERWNDDGSLTMIFDVPAGIRVEFIDKLNDMTQGNVEIEILEDDNL